VPGAQDGQGFDRLPPLGLRHGRAWRPAVAATRRPLTVAAV
jgi:hypothetical protein